MHSHTSHFEERATTKLVQLEEEMTIECEANFQPLSMVTANTDAKQHIYIWDDYLSWKLSWCLMKMEKICSSVSRNLSHLQLIEIIFLCATRGCY